MPEAEGAADIKRPTRSSPTSKTIGRAIGRGHAIAVRSKRSWRELDSNFRFLSGGVPSAVRTRYWASCHSGLIFGGPSRTRAEAVVGALRFAEPIDSNAPLTVPLASYQTAKSPDNDRFESERCLLTPELRAAPLQSRHNTPLLSH